MNPEWRRFAPLGLYLALLAALVSAGLYIVRRELDLYLQISLGLVVVGLALFALLDPRKVREALTGRQARYGSNLLILSLAFTGIVIVANYLVFHNSKRWDLTEDKQFTLASETLEALKSLPSSVTAQAFYTPDLPSDTAEGLLDQYKFHAKGKFEFQFVDPVQNPLAAQSAKVTRNGTVVLSMGANQEVVTNVTEQELTGALVRLINPEKRTVYFLTGHGEFDPDGSGQESFALVKATLESKNYTVKPLNLLADKQIPEDATVIVVAGPRQPVTDEEVKLLDVFLGTGGAMIVMAEPLPLTQFGEAADPLADNLANNWGIQLGQDIVVNIDPNTNQASLMAVAYQYGSHPITEKLERLVSIFPTVRSVLATEAEAGVSQVQLVLTNQESWGETDFAALESQNAQVRPDEGQDTLGPVSLAVAAENFNSGGRVVVFGDVEFASDQYYTLYANGDLFVNALDWAAGQEELINLTPKESKQRLLVPPQTITMNLILLGSVFIIPGMVLVAGVFTFIQRRRRG